jgi:hypothetical protein
MIFKHNCTIHGHRFKPRYDRKPANREIQFKGFLSDEKMEKLFVEKTYVCDVCERCGLIINRDKGANDETS